MLYRVFPYSADAAPTNDGGALFVPRSRQGAGRQDNPESYGALYTSRAPESAAAERIQAFRGQTVTGTDLRRADGLPFALAKFDDRELRDVIDLDDPAELARRQLRPSIVATRDRVTTRRFALGVFEEGVPGFAWWSTLEASWTNVTLFVERALRGLELVGEPEILSVDHPALRSAADVLGIPLG